MYTTYDYYINQYCFGSPVISSAADFQKCLLQAESCIDVLTFNRCKTMQKVPEAVQKCCCELVELIKKHNDKMQQAGVTSEKNKNYSISYESTQSLNQQFEKDKASVIERWLACTGLLYRGC